MINMQQAIHAQEFHAGECVKTIGKRGGVKITQEIWRRNGKPNSGRHAQQSTKYQSNTDSTPTHT